MFRKPHTPIAIVALALALAASPAAVLANSGPTLPDNKSGFDHPAPPSMVVKPSYVIGLPDDRANRAAPDSMTPPAATIVVHSTSGDGFSWSDAAIGAIAMLGLAFVLGAGLAAVRGHRRHAAA
jgi:hypothetical protein